MRKDQRMFAEPNIIMAKRSFIERKKRQKEVMSYRIKLIDKVLEDVDNLIGGINGNS
jgi:hypothetical protein